jgi:UDP-N-acetylglucosamine--N-acetylmuramyl-(pentapeptide) pyrophosphoryl-undecaprenol N-acetylglucosamine transferase
MTTRPTGLAFSFILDRSSANRPAGTETPFVRGAADGSARRPSHRALRVLFAGGGSAGHLRPGIDVARALLALDPRTAIRFAVTSKSLDAELLGATPFPFEVLAAPRLTWNLLGAALAFRHLGRGIRDAMRSLSTFAPDVVVALGGYGSVAPAVAACVKSVPVALLEQNRTPGRANRLLARRARLVFAPFEESRREFLRPDRVEVHGNPVREDLAWPGGREAARLRLQLDPRRPTLLVVGGSQGAAGLNARVADALRSSACSRGRFQSIHVAGAATSIADLEAAYEAGGTRALVLPFSTEMPLLYAASDLVLSRAGGTTLAELTALGKPAVLVPYPHHADRHQERNAELLESRGGASVIRESELTPDVFEREVVSLLLDAGTLSRMASSSRALGRPDAARRVASRLAELASREVRR